ncbi:MAG: 16S rRNA (guanine(966)-N(2))-methyltransferase RsmD [Myxococcales bacterium]|nr:16S rRNA (guanine(966)-N(2))-methyltransferase RsmD [Myxococcales bacterium]
MRIVGGVLGGRRIRAPRGSTTRPTSDRVREALFNILGPAPDGARVLDLFAGTGGLGFEALSRGAVAAVFVEQDAEAARCLTENAQALGLEARVRVLREAVTAALPRLAARGELFELIFADPPYASDEASATLDALGGTSAALLADGALVAVEHGRRVPPADRAGTLERVDRRRWGDTEVSFYRRAA